MDGESSRYDKLESMLQDGSSEPHNLSLEYLRNITNNFSEERLLGEGGFGTVYKGVLPNGVMIAVKKLNSPIPAVKDRHFENEAYHLTRLKHPNVVLLVGWCSETVNELTEYNGKCICADKLERLLCLEYMPKGSLRGYLSDEASGLGWDTRYRIIEGICYGLHYLHEEWQHNTPIIHMDLKPANILLDNNMVPKIADFGLSRLFSEEKTWTCTVNRDGTLGYMAPEYINRGLITTKSDIFSLGVIIIEIVTGHRDYPDENGVSTQEFIGLVLKKWRNRLQKTEGYKELYYYKQILRCIQIGLVCVDLDRSKRPTTSQIIKLLHAESVDLSGRKRVNLPVNMFPVAYPQSHNYQQDDFHRTVAWTLTQGSAPMSMDFHPLQQTLLLVGTNVGDIGLWDVGTEDRLVVKNFKVWELGKCSMALQASLIKDPAVSVNRIIWSPDGTLFGVAYSRHIVQIYSYHGGDDIRQHLEIDAHVGGVNDIAFAHPNKQLCIITCGDDKTIKVWEATSGAKVFTFEDEAPVYSVCPHYKDNIQFIFSTALDGKIRTWLYDNFGPRARVDAPGHWCTTMAYSADGSRLFSCGTNKDGESYLFEWDDTEGTVKRTYQGFRKRSMGVMQFDTTRNRFLAAGDEFLIKIWDMDNTGVLTTIDADGGLPESPRIRFNKEGTLLAVSTLDNGIKILANPDGLRLLLVRMKNHSFDASCNAAETVTKPLINPLTAAANAAAASSSGTPAPAAITAMNGDSRSLVDVKPRMADESVMTGNVYEGRH